MADGIKKVEAVEKTVEADALMTKTEFKEIVEEIVAKQAESVKAREKKFELTGNKEDEVKLVETKKRNETVEFLNAWSNRDVKSLKKMHESRAKALNEGTGSAGGYLVPEEFERTIERLMNDYSVIRQNATRIPMSTDVKRLNSLTGNPTVHIVGELTTITGSQNTFAEPVLTAKKYACITDWSNEVFEDSEVSLIQQIQETIAEEMAQAEENEFINGTTSGSEGLMVVSGVTGNSLISGTTFANITFDDLSAMIVSLENVSNVSNRSAAFYMSPYVYGQLRIKKGTDNHYILPPVPSSDMPASAFGKPIYTCLSMPSSTATGTKFVFYTDLRKTAVIGDRRGMTVKVFDSGSVTESDGTTRNLITQDAEALRVTKRTAFCTRLQTGIVTLATN
ncbi:MAG TPA: phage major capsid protein [Paludibacteraceae bacterium]|nr:phage major capsid protein [Paludibacteraceae bacterium]